MWSWWHQKMRKTTGAWFCVSVLSFLAWELWFIPALNFCSFLKFPRLAFRGRFFSASTQCSTWSLYLCKCITFSCTRGLTSTKTRWRIRRKNCIHTIHMQKISRNPKTSEKLVETIRIQKWIWIFPPKRKFETLRKIIRQIVLEFLRH